MNHNERWLCDIFLIAVPEGTIVLEHGISHNTQKVWGWVPLVGKRRWWSEQRTGPSCSTIVPMHVA